MSNSEIKIFQSEDGNTEVSVRLEKETVWLNQYQMEELFETDRTSIVKHISNIYKSKELNKESTSAKIAQVQKEGNRGITRNILLKDPNFKPVEYDTFRKQAGLKSFRINKKI